MLQRINECAGAILVPTSLLAFLLLLCAGSALGIEKKPAKMWDNLCGFDARAYQMREDFDPEPVYDCWLSYYYYVPCPTYSWFWAYSGWTPGELIGSSFTIGEQPTGPGWPCDPMTCSVIEGIGVLDFAGYGIMYPGMFTFELDVYYPDSTGIGIWHLWNSGPLETQFGWNYFSTWPDRIYLEQCPGYCYPWEQDCPLPTFIVTMTMTGTEGTYPAVGFDNVSMPAEQGCPMHDTGCLPAVYPRAGAGGSEPRVHSGYIGTYPFEFWPPRPFPDGKHAGEPSGAEWYGAVEVAWRVYLYCYGPALEKSSQPATWGSIKSLYK
jgi:hypothetical protein